LALTGDILPPARLTPQTARLIGPAGTPLAAAITITPSPGNPFAITGAKVEHGGNIVFDLKKKPDAAEPHFILHITNTRKNPGRYSDKIILTTTSAMSPELTVRVFGIIREAGD
jgi:hypothetical protein